jgi:hypothetical protein
MSAGRVGRRSGSGHNDIDLAAFVARCVTVQHKHPRFGRMFISA